MIVLVEICPTRLGGLIQDSEGNSVLSFFGPMGVCHVNIAELEALCIGLWEAHRLNLQSIVVEGDSACVRWASDSCCASWILNTVDKFHDLARELEISLVHVLRSANLVADSL